MKKHSENILPVLLGGDLNAYSMATSLKRGRGLNSIVLARDRLAICDGPDYIKLHTVGNLDDHNVAVPVLLDIARRYPGSRLLLIPCADWYVEAVEYARDVLSPHYFMHLPDFATWRAVSDKASFAALMDSFSVPHPRGAVICAGESVAAAARGLSAPYVLKPTDSTEYFRHPFPGQSKVYFPNSIGECTEISARIFDSGYGARLLIQERIGFGGKSAAPATLTAYCDKSGRVICAVRGEVVLEERGKTSRGNYSAIVTSPLTKTDMRLISLLEGIGYTGIANFDLLRGDGGEVCLELNPRQGRSFDYMRAAGINLANMIVDEMCGAAQKPHFIYKEGFWREASLRTVVMNADDPALLARAVALEREGNGVFAYDHVRGEGIPHKIYVALRTARCGRRFSKYKKEAGGYAPL